MLFEPKNLFMVRWDVKKVT